MKGGRDQVDTYPTPKPQIFHQQYGPKFSVGSLIWIYACHCYKTKTFSEVHDQNRLHTTLLKAAFPLSEEFRWGLFT